MEKEFFISSHHEDMSLLSCTSRLFLYETHEGSFDRWASSVRQRIDDRFGSDCRPSVLLFSSNPVTVGHRYVMELAARRSKALVVFVLEDISTVNGNGNPEVNHFALPLDMRLRMTERLAQDMDNVIVLPSGPFMFSRDQITADILPDRSGTSRAHAELFFTFLFDKVCGALDASCVFAGDEPRDELEEVALNVLRQKGSAYGVPVRIAERKRIAERYVCSSIVRDAMNENDVETISVYVPDCVREEVLTWSCR